jgi:hypothetical protein
VDVYVTDPRFLTAALVRGEWSNSRTDRFAPHWKTAPAIYRKLLPLATKTYFHHLPDEITAGKNLSDEVKDTSIQYTLSALHFWN